jgi:hypothetical protein
MPKKTSQNGLEMGLGAGTGACGAAWRQASRQRRPGGAGAGEPGEAWRRASRPGRPWRDWRWRAWRGLAPRFVAKEGLAPRPVESGAAWRRASWHEGAWRRVLALLSGLGAVVLFSCYRYNFLTNNRNLAFFTSLESWEHELQLFS